MTSRGEQKDNHPTDRSSRSKSQTRTATPREIPTDTESAPLTPTPQSPVSPGPSASALEVDPFLPSSRTKQEPVTPVQSASTMSQPSQSSQQPIFLDHRQPHPTRGQPKELLDCSPAS